jgi:hypothetical protein
MKTLLTIAATAALVARPGAGSTQEAPDLIPRNVVLAILRNMPMPSMAPNEPAITLGDRLPDNLLNKVSLPAGAHVIATLESWSQTDVIGTAPGSPDSVRAWFGSEFERRKYEPQSSPGYRQAFRPAERNVMGGFCGAGAYFTVLVRQRPGGLSEFVLHAQQRGTCGQTNLAVPGAVGNWSSSGENPPALPLLVNPKTAEVVPRCEQQGYGQSSSTTRAPLSTTSSADQLLTHYGKQLDSAGWKREMAFAAAVGTWTRRDTAGRDMRVQLTILPAAANSDCRIVTMTSTTVRP